MGACLHREGGGCTQRMRGGAGIEKGSDARGQAGPRARQRPQMPGATALPPQRTLTSDHPLLPLEGERERTDPLGRAYFH